MNFFESVGIMVLLFVLLLVTLNHLSNRDHKTARPYMIKKLDPMEISRKEENKKAESRNEEIEYIKNRIREKYGKSQVNIEIITLSRFSKKCEAYIRNRGRPTYDGLNGFYDSTSRRNITAILKDPLEYWTSVENYYAYIEMKKLLATRKAKQNEYFIKYCEIVFSVFDTNEYLSKNEIVERIHRQLAIEKANAEEVFNLWGEYSLIMHKLSGYDNIEEEIFEISFYLLYGKYDSEIKITRKEWLEKNNKKLIDN